MAHQSNKKINVQTLMKVLRKTSFYQALKPGILKKIETKYCGADPEIIDQKIKALITIDNLTRQEKAQQKEDHDHRGKYLHLKQRVEERILSNQKLDNLEQLMDTKN